MYNRLVRFDWYPTITPGENTDAARTSVAADAHVDFADDEGPRIVDARALAGPNGGWPAVTRDRGELFLIHGSLAFKGFDGARVTKVDAIGWRTLWTTRLIDTAASGEWNYPGGVAAHADGFIYAMYGYRLARLDPASGAVLATLDLPTRQAPRDTTYNGFIVMSDGKIVAKSLYRRPGCQENGFRALARGGVVDTPSDIVVIDPATMTITCTVSAPEHLLGRITASVHRGQSYVYAAGQAHVFRYRYSAGALALDPGWGPVKTRMPGEAPASAITASDGWIFLQGNAGPAPVPFTIHAIAEDDADRRHRVQPFPGGGWSFCASKLTYDGATRRVYTTDGLIGALACFDFDPERGFVRRWQVKQGSYSFLVLIGPPERRVLVATRLVDTPMTWLLRRRLSRWIPWLAYIVRKERVVWRDAASGRALAESGALPVGLAVVPGFDGTIYYPTVFRGLWELKVRGAG